MKNTWIRNEEENGLKLLFSVKFQWIDEKKNGVVNISSEAVTFAKFNV